MTRLETYNQLLKDMDAVRDKIGTLSEDRGLFAQSLAEMYKSLIKYHEMGIPYEQGYKEDSEGKTKLIEKQIKEGFCNNCGEKLKIFDKSDALICFDCKNPRG